MRALKVRAKARTWTHLISGPSPWTRACSTSFRLPLQLAVQPVPGRFVTIRYRTNKTK
ncbi:hypothetical protein B0T26DRAFT_712319 [Lasiosphaeria miniovina]|uniref:Uncharacterized protein n=1 Tax=Lasiosphaeria miniovina TaxID=1954250 RepID=A0AA40ALV9_9PEZI|nr:uncharacterized protein B0T26DRAFT_712319 [Lasiosphaeria miniovina]KAK0718209.1 hypothetical protein B0T26DRAFT_712319 [Lasiosphaeria miniovina]